jgi:hypothetical protein
MVERKKTGRAKARKGVSTISTVWSIILIIPVHLGQALNMLSIADRRHHHAGYAYHILSRTAIVSTPRRLGSASLPCLEWLRLSIMLSFRSLASHLVSDYNTSAQSSLIHCSTNLYLTKCVVPFARAALSPLPRQWVTGFRNKDSLFQGDLPTVSTTVH